jgi:hypothetical protein
MLYLSQLAGPQRPLLSFSHSQRIHQVLWCGVVCSLISHEATNPDWDWVCIIFACVALSLNRNILADKGNNLYTVDEDRAVSMHLGTPTTTPDFHIIIGSKKTLHCRILKQ